MKLLDNIRYYSGRFLLFTSMLAAFSIVYLVTPPVNYTVLYSLIYFLSVTPFLFLIWSFRGYLFDLKFKRKIGIAIICFGLLACTIGSYYYFYQKQIIKVNNPQETNHKSRVYFPYFIDDDLQSEIEKMGGKKEVIRICGADGVREMLANNSTDIAFTNCIFVVLALIGHTLLFTLLMMLYIGFLKPVQISKPEEEYIPTTFIHQVKDTAKEEDIDKEENTDLRQAILKLVQKNEIKLAFDLLLEKGWTRILPHVNALYAKYSDTEDKFQKDLITFDQYNSAMSRIRWSLINLVI